MEVVFLERNIKSKTTITSVAERELEIVNRHIDVLKTVLEEGPIGIIRLSQVTGQPQHIIRYSLRALEKEGVIHPSSAGAIVTDKVHKTLGTLETSFDDIITQMQTMKKKLK